MASPSQNGWSVLNINISDYFEYVDVPVHPYDRHRHEELNISMVQHLSVIFPPTPPLETIQESHTLGG